MEINNFIYFSKGQSKVLVKLRYKIVTVVIMIEMSILTGYISKTMLDNVQDEPSADGGGFCPTNIK